MSLAVWLIVRSQWPPSWEAHYTRLRSHAHARAHTHVLSHVTWRSRHFVLYNTLLDAADDQTFERRFYNAEQGTSAISDGCKLLIFMLQVCAVDGWIAAYFGPGHTFQHTAVGRTRTPPENIRHTGNTHTDRYVVTSNILLRKRNLRNIVIIISTVLNRLHDKLNHLLFTCRPTAKFKSAALNVTFILANVLFITSKNKKKNCFQRQCGMFVSSSEFWKTWQKVKNCFVCHIVSLLRSYISKCHFQHGYKLSL